MNTKGIYITLQKGKTIKFFSFLLLFAFLSGIIFPAYPLSDGPTQPETGAFQPPAQQEHVDLFTGGFNYSVPLFEIGGYPFNLTYNSDVGMEQEASWTGLGWNLNIGSVSRNLRGFPDDFKQDSIYETKKQKPNETYGLNVNVADIELFTAQTGAEGKIIKKLLQKLGLNVNLGLNIIYNNYNGISLIRNAGIGATLTQNTSYKLKGDIGFSTGDGGLTIAPSVSLEEKGKKNDKNALFGNNSMGFSFNSLKGLHNANVAHSYKTQTFGLGSINNDLIFAPSSNFPMRSGAFAFDVKLGPTITLIDLMFRFGLLYNRQGLKDINKYSETYGFFYMYGNTGQQGELLDYSREKDNAYMPGNPYLPQTFLTPDIFSVSTNTYSATFRGFQNRVPVVAPPKVYNPSDQSSLDFGLEFGAGTGTDYGANGSYVSTTSYNGIWSDQNAAYVSHYAQSLGNSFNATLPFKNVYFKNMDSQAKSPFYTVKNTPAKFSLTGSNFNYMLGGNNGILYTKYSSSFSVNEPDVFQPITKYKFITHPWYIRRYYQYESPLLKGHHLRAVKTQDQSGNTYIFGCPAVNNYQKEVSFNVEGPQNHGQFLIGYSANDASIFNSKGQMNYFHSKDLPAYAYAYLLTEILSGEYSDLGGDGPTPDDAGDYVLFSYAKKIPSYKWRTPYTSTQNEAAFNCGMLSMSGNKSDDIASYSYGEKDIWYVDTVKSKTSMAVFYTSPRKDSREAFNEHGGVGPRAMHLLDSIHVYNIHNYYQAYSVSIAPIPDKRIIFNYDYTLCPHVPNQSNSGQGKLTLIDITICEYNSNLGFRQSYRFKYNGGNFAYDPVKVDRWGNYDSSNPQNMNKIEFPYTTSSDLDTLSADAWRLTDIDLPTGGKIKVDYEKGSYAYVQDRPAMQMFPVAAVSNDPDNPSTSGFLGDKDENYYLFFKTDIPNTIPLGDATVQFNKYFDDHVRKNLYFKAKCKIEPGNSPSGSYDMIWGFAEIEEVSLITHNSNYLGRIRLKGVPVAKANSYTIHPFSKAAIHFGMINNPRLVYGHPDLNQYLGQPLQFAKHLILDVFWNSGFLNSLLQTIQGPQKYLFERHVGNYVIPDKSYIRLLSRTAKPGGTSRVKRIIYDNAWSIMTAGNEAGSVIVKEYSYINDDGTTSGVASYEPQLGGDEIPQHLPYTYNYQTKSHKLANWARNLVPHHDYMSFYPLCETAFPNPSVGYARVVEKTRAANGLSNGSVVHEFYTAKDFPTVVTTTDISEKTPHINLIKFQKKHAVVSQGFNVVANDMHGKHKKTLYYDGENNLLKSVESFYHADGQAKYYSSSAGLMSGLAGAEHDAVVDLREESSVTNGISAFYNFTNTAVPLPLALVAFYGIPDISETTFRSATHTSVFYKKGVMYKQEIKDRGADLSVQNLYYDPNTGSNLISSVNDRWNKKTYSYELPAYYIYKQMGSASQYSGHSFKITTDGTGKITSSFLSNLNDGDQLIVTSVMPFYFGFAWVINRTNGKYLISQNGTNVINISNVRTYLWQSGRKNILQPSVYKVVSKQLPPVQNNMLQAHGQQHEILSAEALTYKDYYSYRCIECDCNPESYTDSITHYYHPGQHVKIKYLITKQCSCGGTMEIISVSPSDLVVNLNNLPPGLPLTGLCNNDNVTVNFTFHGVPIADNVVIHFSGLGGIASSETVNPFIYKLRNAWNIDESYVYKGNRFPELTTDAVKPEQQGHYTNYSPFWYYDNNDYTWKDNNDQWTMTEKITYRNIHGSPVESRNILNIFNAAIFGFGDAVQEAVTSNTTNNQIAFDSFEDYYHFYSFQSLNSYYPPPGFNININSRPHFRFARDYPSWVTTENAHTGYCSLKLNAGDSICHTTKIQDSVLIEYPGTQADIAVEPWLCSDVFFPMVDKTYLLSFWVNKPDTAWNNFNFAVWVDDISNVPCTVEYLSPPVEGWQQYTVSFAVRNVSVCNKFTIKIFNSGSYPIFVDDFRIHPYNANMKSFVYNPFTHQLVATLDENNFATIYQYDVQQQVQNYIKETEKGRVFVNYNIKHLFKK